LTSLNIPRSRKGTRFMLFLPVNQNETKTGRAVRREGRKGPMELNVAKKRSWRKRNGLQKQMKRESHNLTFKRGWVLQSGRNFPKGLRCNGAETEKRGERGKIEFSRGRRKSSRNSLLTWEENIVKTPKPMCTERDETQTPERGECSRVNRDR